MPDGAPGTARRGVFEALGDPVRRRLLELLASGEQPAGDLVAAVRAEAGISQPAVSQHLRVLRDARLVTVRAEGTRRHYAVDDAGLDVVRLWLARFAEPFAQPLDALETELARGRRERRRGAPVEATAEALVEVPVEERGGTGGEARGA
ncbi:metalloregulator ArsR/SmtB family transcription factor [Isoptericola sp. 4D.3]|uniref:Metalloregulator ArsR/SmtB family transcription factor n=1 Tax=Isoptericola peretonis TaxID=2918523 RepID=A0ABT0J2T8_9MICO|nr:metalloregulator ArsR/SmtB family transcription factor [Isoptericola sp. 4D.3]